MYILGLGCNQKIFESGGELLGICFEMFSRQNMNRGDMTEKWLQVHQP